MNIPKFHRCGFLAPFLGGASVCTFLVAGCLSGGSLAQTSAPLPTVSAHPALVDCQKRFREAAISASVVFVPSTMAEVCSTVEQSCKPETEGNSDCQKAVANVGKHVAASFGSREAKPIRGR